MKMAACFSAEDSPDLFLFQRAEDDDQERDGYRHDGNRHLRILLQGVLTARTTNGRETIKIEGKIRGLSYVQADREKALFEQPDFSPSSGSGGRVCSDFASAFNGCVRACLAIMDDTLEVYF